MPAQTGAGMTMTMKSNMYENKNETSAVLSRVSHFKQQSTKPILSFFTTVKCDHHTDTNQHDKCMYVCMYLLSVLKHTAVDGNSL